MKKGFTLIELLVVVALVGIIGTITTQVFILGLQSQNKTEISKEIKQNGDYILSILESMVRNAVDVQITSNQCNTNLNSLTILNQDGYTSTFDCSSLTSISSISGILANPTPTGIPLNGSNVKISNCNFRVVCPNPPVSPKYVYISFTVSASAITGVTPLPQFSSTLDYQTTVTLRNYQ